MASKEGQAILTTIGASSIEQKLAQMRETVARLTKKAEKQNLQVTALANAEGRSLSTSATNGASIGATTTPQRATTEFVPSKEQNEHHKREPVINLTSLGAPRMLVAQVLTVGAISVEEKLAQMKETIARLTETAEEKDLQITALTNRLGARYEEGDGSGIEKGADEEEEPPVEKPEEKQELDQPAALLGALSIQQLQEMIANTIKAQYEGSSYTSVLYSKPYSKRIDALRMPRGYQPPKFMQFDGKGNPKQHVAHFVETCNNAGTEGDHIAKQFVRSLKGNAFEWYTDIQPESINSWEQLEKEFLNRFYSTRRTVSMLEMTSTKQWRDEPVMDYINRWRNLSLDCKDRLSEISAIEMCVQGMHWSLHYILQGIKPRSFEELATRAHDMELSIAHHGKKEPFTDHKNDKVFGPKVEKAAWKPTKEAMTVNTAPVKVSTRGKAIQTEAFRDQEMHRRTFKELEEKTYPFLDSDVAAMLKDLLDKKVIDLPECRRPEEMNRTDSPRYCKFHRFISHPTEKCFVLKDLIMKLAQKGIIELDLDDVVKSNYITVTSGSFDSKSSPQLLGASNQDVPTDDDEGWTLVTAKKTRKPKPAPRTSVFDRLNHSGPRNSTLDRIGSQDRTSVFKRLSTPTPQSSVFERLSKPKKQSGTTSFPPRRSALDRLEETKKTSRKRKTTPEEEKFDGPAEKCNVRSLIPSRMKRQVILEVDTNGPLKVRKHTIVHTGQSSSQQTHKDGTEEEVKDVFPIIIQEDKEDVTFGSFNSKSSPQPLGAYSKSSKVEGWTHVTPKKLHEKHTSSPQVHQSERGQSSFRQPPKQCESVEDKEISTQRSYMRHLFFLENLFKYSVKAPCYEDCEERLSKIGSKKLDKKHTSRPQVHQLERGQSNFRQTPEKSESVGDNETSTERLSIPVTMDDLFPEDLFDYSAKAPCYEDCEDRLSYTA